MNLTPLINIQATFGKSISRIAEEYPKYKSGQTNEANSYQLISLLCFFNNTGRNCPQRTAIDRFSRQLPIVRLVFKQKVDHLTKNNIYLTLKWD